MNYELNDLKLGALRVDLCGFATIKDVQMLGQACRARLQTKSTYRPPSTESTLVRNSVYVLKKHTVTVSTLCTDTNAGARFAYPVAPESLETDIELF